LKNTKLTLDMEALEVNWNLFNLSKYNPLYKSTSAKFLTKADGVFSTNII
jgi:hypothetical protein